MIAMLVILALAAILVLWVIATYNRLIKNRNLKDEGWSGVDVQLKRRHDLVDNLVRSVKAYMQHERGLLEEIARVRSLAAGAKNVADAAQNEGMLTSLLGKLFAVMENYPDLKASENTMELQKQLASLENDIQLARRYYNATVRDYNTSMQVFPSNIIASMFHFEKGVFFELDNPDERQAPQVQF